MEPPGKNSVHLSLFLFVILLSGWREWREGKRYKERKVSLSAEEYTLILQFHNFIFFSARSHFPVGQNLDNWNSFHFIPYFLSYNFMQLDYIIYHTKQDTLMKGAYL